MKTKVLLLNGGGVDTLAVVLKLIALGYEVHSLLLNIGQLNAERIKEAARTIAREYCASHTELDMFQKGEFVRQTERGITGVAFQAGVIFMIGAMYARAKGFDYLASGLKNDAVEEGFNEAFLELCRKQKMAKPVIPMRPLSNLTEFREVYEIVKNDPLLKETYSCHTDPKCGVCEICKQRVEHGIDA